MAYNGSGVYSPPAASFPAVSGTVIDSAKYNAVVNDMATALTTAITKDGQTTITANLPMATYRHTGVSDGTALTDYASLNQVVDNALAYGGTSAVGTDAYAVTLSVSPGAYAAGNRYQFIADVANTGACTIDFSGVGAKSIKLADGTDPHNGAIQTDMVDVIYDGTNFVLINPFFTGLKSLVTKTELDILDGATVTTAELNILDGVTATASEINALDGITATVTELNYTDGVTSAIQTQMDTKSPIANPTFTGEIGIGSVNVSETELGILEGATVTTAELNILDGVTATTAELNKLDGVTATTVELNYTDGVTSAIQTQMNLKAALASPALTGNPTAPTQTAGNDSTRVATTAYVQTHTAGLQTKVIDIGDWDMDANASATVSHGLTSANIRNIDAIIRNDAATTMTKLWAHGASARGFASMLVSGGDILIYREDSGSFDSASYDSTSFNRGWITIQYVD